METKEQLIKTFSENLKYYMHQANKLQIDIIRDLGFGSGIVSEWVSGKKYPRIDRIEILANYLHIQKSQLIEVRIHDDESYQPKDMMIYNPQDITTTFMASDKETPYVLTSKRFGIVIQDDTMQPTFLKGDTLTIDPKKEMQENTVMMFLIHHKINICQVIATRDNLVLQPLNKGEKSITYNQAEINKPLVIGAVISLYRNYESK